MSDHIHSRFLPVIEEALQDHLNNTLIDAPAELRQMIAYHMGWEGMDVGKVSHGKRIRPLLILLTVDACGKDWIPALPAAIAVEYLHNFSLIHDDIQDQSPLRHGRDTMWKRWGIPQAINTGDSMFSMAYLALLNSKSFFADPVIFQIFEVFSKTCIKLTEGQHLDMHFESQKLVTESEYLTMISGKTAALVGCCVKMGAILGALPKKEQDLLGQFGFDLGMAFQIQDDILGIWGNQTTTGKSTDSDLVSGKKSLPVIHAMDNSVEFTTAWRTDHTSPRGIARLMELFEQIGSRIYTKSIMEKYTRSSLEALHLVFRDKPLACQYLETLAIKLLERKA